MDTDSANISLMGGIAVIAVIGASFFLYYWLKKGGKKMNGPKYTEKDKDMLELIHELAVVYKNTDSYLKR